MIILEGLKKYFPKNESVNLYLKYILCQYSTI